jgi:hypothetical protein
MTYRKGEQTAHANERNCPHIVEFPVPENGFGKTLDFIFVFHANLGIEPKRGSRQRREDQEFARWCFADPQHAASFQALFGGEAIRAIQRMN